MPIVESRFSTESSVKGEGIRNPDIVDTDYGLVEERNACQALASGVREKARDSAVLP